MKSGIFVLALYIFPVVPESGFVRIGYFDSRDHCRSEAPAIIRTLRKRNPDWINVMFHCRVKRSRERVVIPRTEFLPDA